MAGTFAGIFGIKMWGKRKSYLIALLGVIISAFTLCKLMWFFFNYFENNFVWLENWIWNLCNLFFYRISCLWTHLFATEYKIIWARAYHKWRGDFNYTVDLFLFDAIFHNNYDAGKIPHLVVYHFKAYYWIS